MDDLSKLTNEEFAAAILGPDGPLQGHWARAHRAELLRRLDAPAGRFGELDLGKIAQEIITALTPAPLECRYCGQATSFAPINSGYANTCPMNESGHVYEMTIGGEDKRPEIIAKVLTAALASPRPASQPRDSNGHLHTCPEHWQRGNTDNDGLTHDTAFPCNCPTSQPIKEGIYIDHDD